ncbi:restriction endonuclease subunit S [Acinetobacter haemolyticus]|uniref:restriction endonuclease subunit S n=1 Tax=Acinetobacter haemolyticus TaxID=29430 RepID=UPI001372F579|nr:restriction endonuclease subunit S [Acinetobacter haemolyticus]NAR60533.1 restriction endonuclease subunit S [Acinetobacter haemolyticus]NAR66868.1 restriction endonuclease subunit S [Acinetobacter haemolyticus]NAR70524.1 restriction endonuclease subunit S [Acinetobacter haemolyticus]NAR83857.1 restriction endonuclease subunit S [Acinetobacter haemolyticus]NAR92707.1 restriction endonuclease subunit S [Acinetobacter haemolyticus]
MAAPKLRFKEFDGDWLKVDIQSLVDEKIIDKPMDGNHGEIHPTSADYVEDGIPFVMATDVIDGKVYLDKSKKIKKSQADGLRKGFSLEGDILLTHKATIGNVAKVPELKTPYIMLTPQVTYYRVLNKDKLNQDFIKSTFEAPVFQNALLALCTGATRLYIGISEQRKLPFSYPSKKEQTKIASFLSAVDEKISQLTQKHQLLSQYKQGMMQKLFSQQIRFKADDGSEFGEWEDKPLNEIASKRSGKNKDGSISEVLTNSATQGIIKQSDYFEREIVTESNLNGYYIVNLDDFVYNPRISVHAPVGPIKRNKKCLGVMSPLYTVFTVSEGNLAYLEYFFDSNFWHDYVKGVANSGARHDRMNITNKDFFDMPIFYPCLEEQTKIANFLSSIDQKIEVVAQQIEQAKTWKKGLLQQMFV